MRDLGGISSSSHSLTHSLNPSQGRRRRRRRPKRSSSSLQPSLSSISATTGMARCLGFLFLIISLSICEAAIIRPISDSHRSAALEVFTPTDGSFESLEETYEALRTLQILGIDKTADISPATCPTVLKKLHSESSNPKDLFNALRVGSILKCEIDADTLVRIASKLQVIVKDSSSLFDLCHSIGSLILIKDIGSGSSVLLEDAVGTFHSIKALSQSDGRWRHSSNGAESSTYAAGLALEALAGVVSLSSSEIDQSLVSTVKTDILKLFDSLEKYDDGAFYFDEKVVDAREDQSPLSTSASVVRGLVAFTTITSGKLNLPGDKVLGLAKFFLGIGVPGSAKDFFNQIDSLYSLENNRVSIPLILSLPATVLSLTKGDQLKSQLQPLGTMSGSQLQVKVSTVLGSDAPPLTIKLLEAFSSSSSSSSKGSPLVENQELKFDQDSSVHSLDVLPMGFDVGKYTFVFRVSLHDPEHKKIYATGGQSQVPIFVTGLINIDNVEIAILDSDIGSTETKQKLDLSGETSVLLSANHLQKLRLSFQLTTALGHSFRPHQVFLKLTHETKVEHIFVVGNSGSQFDIILDFLGLVDKFYYLSGKYNIQLTVGDVAMENSLLRDLGTVELDLPEPSEKAARPPLQSIDPYTRFGPKQEIAHIFRLPEKRPPQELSLAFLALVAVPLLGFLIGLVRLGVNLKNFPTSAVPATFAVLFHAGIAAVLSLYLLFWLKLDLFTTLKTLGFLGVFLLFVGHRTLSYLASVSAKLKSA